MWKTCNAHHSHHDKIAHTQAQREAEALAAAYTAQAAAAADDSCLTKIVAQKINDMGLPAMIGDIYIYR